MIDLLDFIRKKKDEETDIENYEMRRTQVTKMLAKINHYLEKDFQDSTESETDPNIFYRILEKEIKNYVEKQKKGNVPIDALALFYISDDYMKAYVCILPPLNGGKEVEEEHFLEDMRYEGIASGIDNEAVSELVSTKNYLRIVQIASGKFPKDGVDGILEELYEHKNNQALELDEEEMLQGEDFRKKNFIQIIREGEVLCRITPAVPEEEGFDVSGRILHGRQGVPVRIPQGKNTSISEDGLLLQADISGIVVMEGENFCVQSQRVLEQDINASVGDLKFDGDIYIQGNVDDGVTINATGNVMIDGDIRNGKIISGGTICVMGNVKGTSQTRLKASKQIQCMIMENVSASAIEDICAGVIANSEIISERGSIYALMGRGLIFGSHLTSGRSVYAKKIGNISGCVNKITLGLNAEFERRKKFINNEMEEINRDLEQLRKNISSMQLSRRNHRLDTEDEYKSLVEQRNVYGELKKAKMDELLELNQALRSIRVGTITCDDIYPVTKIYIEKQSLMIEQRESDCNIHLQSGRIQLR